MTWIKPEYSKTQVGKAGDVLIGKSDKLSFDEASKILSNWRGSHAFPLNNVQSSLRHKARTIDPDFLITQRLKRIVSIKNKLERFSSMKLHRMQDIGGCRIILNSIDSVYNLVNDIKTSPSLDIQKIDDYITSPKESGYRSIHLISKYCGRKEEYKDLRIEIQVRSKIQHYWATAVETIDTFTKQQLKTGGGDDDWFRFFNYMSRAMNSIEKKETIPNKINREIKNYENKLKVIEKLTVYSIMTEVLKESSSRNGFFLLILNPENNFLKIQFFRTKQITLATEEYIKTEKNNPESNVVLVEAKSIQDLQRGYPNYFADSEKFLKYLKKVIK